MVYLGRRGCGYCEDFVIMTRWVEIYLEEEEGGMVINGGMGRRKEGMERRKRWGGERNGENEGMERRKE